MLKIWLFFWTVFKKSFDLFDLFGYLHELFVFNAVWNLMPPLQRLSKFDDGRMEW